MDDNLVTTEWIESDGQQWFKFAFIGHLTHGNARSAASKWRSEFALNIRLGQKVDIIYNCEEMTGYDTNARKLWQEVMKELKPFINTIWIISNNKAIILAARTMGLISGYSIKALSNEHEIHPSLQTV